METVKTTFSEADKHKFRERASVMRSLMSFEGFKLMKEALLREKERQYEEASKAQDSFTAAKALGAAKLCEAFAYFPEREIKAAEQAEAQVEQYLKRQRLSFDDIVSCARCGARGPRNAPHTCATQMTT